ncbi:MAG: putative HMP/thiamine import ATP-binding protein YkoD [Candidatus Heimdallarchaeota archaeon LC_2]|nr:MAG: putative HMP/thiamine import ATP-binding protein YkoD [Candidatus Heimdallarchaeota archaeon LC_2]
MIMEVKNLTIRYKNNSLPQLSDINFKVDKGQCVVISGKMGSGKSTLFWAITKLFSPGTLQSATGEINVKFPIVLISQRIKSQILTFNVSEELVTKMSFENIDRQQRWHYIRQISKEYNLENIVNRDMRNLSSGQQQMVIILANLFSTSDKFIILLDEPLSLLDSSNSFFILSLLNKLAKKGNTIIIADTRPERYSDLNPTYYEIKKTKLVPLKNDDPNTIKINNYDVFPQTEKLKKKSLHLNLEIGYSKSIQHFKQDISPNGILLVTGVNGSGKTALLLTLAKIIKPYKILSNKFSFPQSLYLPQDTFSFFWKESVLKELEDTFDIDHLPNWIKELSKMSPFLLSEGQRKKLGLEICFSHEKTLLLDEPTQSLDHESIAWLIKKLEKHSMNNLIVIATNDEWFSKQFQDEVKIINFELGD